MDKENTISGVKARQVLDSRGNPTVEADVFLASGHVGRAMVPSGASTGAGEALELRDGDKNYYDGKSVLKAVWNVNSKIADVIVGNPAKQELIDRLMIELDGTENKSNLGANAILAVSLGLAKALARYYHLHLYDYIAKIAGTEKEICLPLPMMNVMNGGAHADWSTDFQEYMIMPISAQTMDEAIEHGARVFYQLKNILHEKGYATTVGDEGGFAPKLGGDNNEPLELIREAVERAGLTFGKDIVLAMDVAASEFYNKDHYELKTNGDWKWSNNLIDWWTWITENYPMASIEDGLAETDWEGWQEMTDQLGEKVQLVGDDLFVTNTKLLARGIEEKVANAILIKPNQIGSVTETIEAVKMAKQAGYRTVMSHRSGETEDSSIVHLAVGLGTGQVKIGSLSRTDRVSKYNELLRIAEGDSSLGFNEKVRATLRQKA